MAGRTKIDREKTEIGLQLLEAPWHPDGREYVIEKMDELGLKQDDLFVALRNAEWKGSYSTLKRWLRETPYKPDGDELWLLVVVLAGYSANWPKASNLSSPQEAYSFWPIPRANEDLRLPIPA